MKTIHHILLFISLAILVPATIASRPGLAVKKFPKMFSNTDALTMYSASKAQIILYDYPTGADIIQATISPTKSHVRLIGHRNKRLEGKGEIKFLVNLPKNAENFELVLKSFTRTEESYQKLATSRIPVTVQTCTGTDKVCALVKHECPEGKDCVEIENIQTFDNTCEADKVGAQILYNSSC